MTSTNRNALPVSCNALTTSLTVAVFPVPGMPATYKVRPSPPGALSISNTKFSIESRSFSRQGSLFGAVVNALYVVAIAVLFATGDAPVVTPVDVAPAETEPLLHTSLYGAGRERGFRRCGDG